ncbi:transglycosylase SLT domain-containing protein [Shewanella sp. Isolate11]|uniref:transglycosylase SLT domain-containing protein n=1 Tax=Shewanella sp. Isolate11 TaxID=2908530 RepID=UPI001EFD8A75|nr:transglycosylase SLT domain-containing protein [Shewanella sp. Isolate11]MCG9696536.1 transglycosylase SLT domain-containing protein [Shewanella sp. Isolate11]
MFYNTLVCMGLTLSLLFIGSSQGAELTKQQQQYLDARAALNDNNFDRYSKLRSQLDNYPLTPYLDFNADMDQLLASSGKQALKRIEPFKGMPLYQSARYRYLVNAGKQKRWQHFLTISPTAPNNTALQCYFYRAQLANNNSELAYKGAEKLWLSGQSRPKECDPLFSAWEKSGHRSQALIWSRMLLSFNSGQYSLLRFLAKKVTHYQQQAQLLVSVYKDPRSLRSRNKFMGKAPIYADMVDAGLRRLARSDIEQAVSLFQSYRKAHRFSDYQAKQLQRYLMRRALIEQQTSLKPFIDQHLANSDSDDLTMMRLRWAIRENDQQAIEQWLPLLSADTRAKSRWQFWLTQSQLTEIDKPKLLNELAKQRNFYGFMASHLLGQKVQLQNQATAFDKNLSTTLSQDPGLARVIELRAIDKIIDARAEWVLLLGRHNKATQAQYALLAQQRQWQDLAVQASIQGKLWNDMDLRFPYPAEEIFHNASQKAAVDINEIRAIARRESAFYPYATSGVGARGMMQLMPTTAKATAKKLGLKYRGHRSLYDEALNIQLGSQYYAYLLSEFDDNRVLATAAYNAGPSRVKQWLDKSNGQLNVVAFIESIPFRETREYVQAVLSYRVIYQSRQNKPTELFSEKELSFKY